MNRFHITKALGYGAVIWLIMFAFMSALEGFGVLDTLAVRIAAAFIPAIIAFLFARQLEMPSGWYPLGYGLVWVVIGITFDLLVTYQFNNTIFSAGEYWLGYTLLFAAPWLNTRDLQQLKPF